MNLLILAICVELKFQTKIYSLGQRVGNLKDFGGNLNPNTFVVTLPRPYLVLGMINERVQYVTTLYYIYCI